MSLIWKEFPEINRKVGFQAGTANTSASSLGCHCGMISGVRFTFGTGYYSGGDGKNILVMDTEKEPQIKYTRNRYNDYWIPPKEETEKITKLLTSGPFPNMHMEEVYLNIVASCSKIPLWVMSDVINYGSSARQKDPFPSISEYTYINLGSTADFAKYLINNKTGYVLQSPIIQNPAHRTTANYSLNQAWFWIHPDHLARAIDTAEVFGDDKFPTPDEWAATVAKDFAITTAEVAAKVFSTGVFPEDKRFRVSRTIKKMSPRVKQEIQKALDEGKPEIEEPLNPMIKEA